MIQPPERSVIIMLTDEEEAGLDGAREWLEDPTIPREQIVFGMSVDPVGRPSLPDYWPTLLIGTERSPELDGLWRSMAHWNNLPTVFLHRDLVPVLRVIKTNCIGSTHQFRLLVREPRLQFLPHGRRHPETVDYRILKEDVRFWPTR